jgi:hypothetical protein
MIWVNGVIGCGQKIRDDRHGAEIIGKFELERVSGFVVFTVRIPDKID